MEHARNLQLDWCVDDLTPATRFAYDSDYPSESSTDSEGDADTADELLAILEDDDG